MTMTTIINRITELINKAETIREDISWAEIDDRRYLRNELQEIYNEISHLQAQKEAMTLRS
jgi:hypothetical protein